MSPAFDVIVVGAGNAAFCAALAAQEGGARVLMLERAPETENGGNSRFTAGGMRIAYRGADDLKTLMPDLTSEEIANTDFGSYTTEQFFDGMFRVTRFRTDQLVTRSYEATLWLQRKGVRFVPIYGRQTIDGHAVTGVRVKDARGVSNVTAPAVVLACGGFEANAEWRTRYLGPGWELAKVRGTRFNTGDGIRMALDIGASPHGNWSGCHAVGWDNNAPEFGDLAVGDGFQKHSYQFGIMVNADGQRFVDEGADIRNYTDLGRALAEPTHVAFA
jgi:tricarballylate dehydrogenase